MRATLFLCSVAPSKPRSCSGPRTKLPFLINVVKKAQQSENSAVPRVERGLSSSSSTPTAPPLLSLSSFKSYPKLPSRAVKQTSGSSLLYKDDDIVIVNDAFPKSMVHCLVMPLDTRLLSLDDLSRSDIPLLRHMIEVSEQFVEFLKTTAPLQYRKRRFITGFHALPSLPMLHMHLMTMDLDSPCLKNKKHYNSFATFFFLTSDRVLQDLESHGRVTLNKDVKVLKRMEEQEMRCLWCGATLANIPTMKSHLKSCSNNRAAE